VLDAVLDEVVEPGECDFVSDIAGRMASYVIADLLGLEQAQRSRPATRSSRSTALGTAIRASSAIPRRST